MFNVLCIRNSGGKFEDLHKRLLIVCLRFVCIPFDRKTVAFVDVKMRGLWFALFLKSYNELWNIFYYEDQEFLTRGKFRWKTKSVIRF